MAIFFSPGCRSFYVEGIHFDMPADCIEVSPWQHDRFIEIQSQGRFPVWNSTTQAFDEIDAPNAELPADLVRRIRNNKLAACDRMMLIDAPITTEQQRAWIEYRQALRNLPEQEGFPKAVQWPVEPA